MIAPMPQGEKRGFGPARTLSYCAGGDYGSADAPKSLIQVNAHRRHHPTPGCDAPPMVQAADGGWVQAGDSRRLDSQLRPAHPEPVEAPEPESPPSEEPPPPPVEEPIAAAAPFSIPGLELPAPPPVAPRAPVISGEVSIPVPPKATEPADGPLFGQKQQLRFAPDIYELYSWLVQMGFGGSFEQALEQGFRTYMMLRWRKAIGVVDVDDSMLARALGQEAQYAA